MTGIWLVIAGAAISFWSGFLEDPAPVLSYGFILMAAGCLFIAGEED